VATHDLRHLRPVRRTTGHRVEDLSSFAEILRTNRRWRNYAERLHVLCPVVIEAVNGAARNTECLPGLNVDLLSVDSPSQYSIDAVDRLFVMVVAMGRSRQALRTRDHELKGRDGARRVLSGDQEANHERTQTDGFVGKSKLWPFWAVFIRRQKNYFVRSNT